MITLVIAWFIATILRDAIVFGITQYTNDRRTKDALALARQMWRDDAKKGLVPPEVLP